jgi:chaperonin GroEL
MKVNLKEVNNSIPLRMDYKEIILGEEARQRIKEGINDLAEAVLVTMGPEGKTVIIPDEYGNPKVTKDGVSVAKAITFKDPIKNIGAQLIKEVAKKTVDEVGDGTTTSICLANAFINTGHELLLQGYTPNQIKDMLEQLEELTLNILVKVIKPIEGNDIEHVATIAANNDKSIGKLIKQAFRHSNVVRVDKGFSAEHKVELINGMQIRSGVLDQRFINDGATKSIIYENARILVIDGHLRSLKPIEAQIRSLGVDEPLIIIVDEVEDHVAKILLTNYVKGSMIVGIIKSPGHAQHRLNLMEDIRVACKAEGLKLGHIKSIKANTDKTILEFEYNEAVGARLSDLKKLMDTTHEDYDKELLQQRIDLLEGNVAVIKVGGNSDVEIGETYDRVEDAVLATKCAIEEGVIEGGGYALRCAVGTVEPNPFAICLRAPYDQLEANGFNWLNIKNFYNEGILDPVKVTKVALINAVSVAKTVLGIEAIIN